MEIKTFVFNPFYENTHVISTSSGEAIIIDPGCYEKFERDELIKYVTFKKLTPIAILCTHCHIDHVLGCAFFQEHYKIPVWIPEGELEVLKSMEVMAPHWGITGYETTLPDKLLKKDDTIQLGKESLKIRFAPGHSPGHFMYYHESEQTLIAGDVIFRESIGRTDLPGGDHDTLLKSIRSQVYTLPDRTTIYTGHGPTTTVEYEKSNNPFVRPE